MSNLSVAFSNRNQLSITPEKLLRFVGNCDQSDDIHGLLKTADADLKEMGFEWFAFRYIPIIGAKDYNKFGKLYIPKNRSDKRRMYDAFFEAHTTEDEVMKRTPIESYILEHGCAVWFKDIIELESFQTPLLQEYAQLALNDFKNAVFVPAFGLNGCRGTFLFGCGEKSEQPDYISMARLEYMAFHFLRRFHQIGKQYVLNMKSRLSSREKDILQLLPHGLSTKEIARELAISPNTVDSHLKSIFLKLDAPDRMTATMRWLSLK